MSRKEIDKMKRERDDLREIRLSWRGTPMVGLWYKDGEKNRVHSIFYGESLENVTTLVAPHTVGYVALGVKREQERVRRSLAAEAAKLADEEEAVTKIFRVDETAKRLDISEATLYRLVRMKRITPTRVSDRRIVFTAKSINDYLDKVTRPGG